MSQKVTWHKKCIQVVTFKLQVLSLSMQGLLSELSMPESAATSVAVK